MNHEDAIAAGGRSLGGVAPKEVEVVVRAFLEARGGGPEITKDMKRQFGGSKWNHPDDWDTKDEWWGLVSEHHAVGANLLLATLLAGFEDS